MAQMQVILLERVENLGQMGDVVKVKLGYARNFLLPQRKALRATEENVGYFESRRAQLEADNLKRRGEAESVAGKMDKARVSIVRQAGETGQLYGSVAARDVAEGLTATGYRVDKRQIVIDRPIKMIGIHTVRIVLHPEVSVSVLVNVGQSEDEAKLQFERFDRGEAPVVLKTDLEAAAAPAPAPPPAAQAAPAEATEEAPKPAPRSGKTRKPEGGDKPEKAERAEKTEKRSKAGRAAEGSAEKPAKGKKDKAEKKGKK
jgi:large subunit ribosomal protein L9